MNPKNERQPTFSDLRHMYGTGRAVLLSGEGRNKVYGYRHGIRCALGDIELTDWQKMMKELIRRSREEELHRQLTLWVKEHSYTQRDKAEFEQEVLELHSLRIFDNPEWVGFIPFNQKYRPDALIGIPLVTACSECCGTPFVTTQARIDCDGKEQTYCGICGRWSPYQILSADPE